MTHARDVMPPPHIIDAINGSATHVLRSVDIYEEDGTTPFLLGVGVIDGSVTVDASRDERRTVDLSLDNSNWDLAHYPGGFWYDKVIKAYRGVHIDWHGLTEDDPIDAWDIQIGEFLIDDITSQDFPSTISITGRDYTKKLLEDEFAVATSFQAGEQVTEVVRAIALNAGITKFILPPFSPTLGRLFEFEAGTTRWQAIKDIATAFTSEVYFDAFGHLVMRPFLDPTTSPLSWTFATGNPDGNLVSYTKRTSSAQLYNAVVIVGKQPDSDIPIVAVAENHMPGSPTSIEALGRRKVFRYTSEFITTQAQAEELAASYLRIYALEEFDLSLESLVYPWLEASEIIEFRDPYPHPGDPDRFLLHDFTIPMGLGAMSLTGKRVHIVGDVAPIEIN